MTRTRPTVKLRPGKGRRLARGAPWAFADEIALDRRTKALAPGTLVQLVDGPHELGLAAFNPLSQIAARVLDRDPAADLTPAWFRARLARAEALRSRLYDTPFYRLVHAEADGLPGVVIDRYGAAVVIQPNAAWAETHLDGLIEAVEAQTGADDIVVNASARVRKLEGLDTRVEQVRGDLAGPVPVSMNGATYLADLIGGQKTGLFYDQRPNHAFAMAFAPGARVLDVFCHVGGFGLAALGAGAASVLAIDSSAPALALAEDGAARTGGAGQFRTERAEAFPALDAQPPGAFDLVVCDPPAFAPAKPALEAGLRAYEKTARLAALATAGGGMLVLCSCSHAVSVEAFHKACVSGIRAARRTGQLVHSGRAGPDHPVHFALPETSYLKALFFRLDG